MTDEQFKKYLINLYFNKKYSIPKISKILGITSSTTRKYFKMYNIPSYNQKDSIKLFNSGSNNHKWNNGRSISSHGYIAIHMPEHPYADKRGYVYEHRLVMEKSIGRYLSPEEVVHHKDFNKTNNNLSNLQVLSNSEHTKLHAQLKGGGLHGSRSNKS